MLREAEFAYAPNEALTQPRHPMFDLPASVSPQDKDDVQQIDEGTSTPTSVTGETHPAQPKYASPFGKRPCQVVVWLESDLPTPVQQLSELCSCGQVCTHAAHVLFTLQVHLQQTLQFRRICVSWWLTLIVGSQCHASHEPVARDRH